MTLSEFEASFDHKQGPEDVVQWNKFICKTIPAMIKVR